MKYWNAVLRITHGCTPCASGCAYCWAAKEAHMRQFNPLVAARYRDLTEINAFTPQFNGTVRTHPENIAKAQTTKRPKVWQIWNDLFHDAVPDNLISEVMALARIKQDHTFIALTKRPKRMFEISHRMMIPKNLYLGVSITSSLDQTEPFMYLRNVNAPSKMISFEPCVGAADLAEIIKYDHAIKLVVCGGESGRKLSVRPCPRDAVWAALNDCVDNGVCFYFKQWGAFQSGHLIDGKEYLQLPWIL